ncbi:E3 ubiquitin-protein ligase RNF19A-like [Plectropomus leopardus]|uniref:E3 ubiquitin-protein ligase RNF19A-like n=1 Tax=Plectropomus leopardus TaxID=160734 RepID=UPI001C4ABCCB|nr:E3 ubiquitin-protein ligase RNF19A-like [Plectropomus leopardus]XP_042362022.1 E3 ubiquitin-protein ligase RNF19A-like [Plectropomus leopardus]
MSSLHQQHHGSTGSERDLHSAASSVSLPSVRKPPKKRRLSLHSLFGRRRRPDRDPKRKSRPLQSAVGVDGIVSTESVQSETVHDKTSAHSAPGVASTSSVSGSSELLECPLCLLRHARERFPDIMTCHHRSCADCLRQYLRIEISESRVNICCPECSERFNPHDIQMILGDRALMEKYEEFMLRRWLVAEPDCRWCPAPDCGYAVIAFGCASCPKITCGREGCGTEFCYHCKQLWHPNQTCDTARQQRAQTFRLRSFRSSSLSYSQESGAAGDDIKPCPRCAAYIIKMNDGSCNHMTCAVCGCEFCWLCMKEISDLHYLSPSGCTFWGKKPWSRKKKILWQLGTLVGAPVGIALIAGIAIPAMIIGIPVYVGRKIHNRYEGKDISKHKRNLVIAGGVTLSVIVSPVVAAVTVGIGVPIMLAYVYGVVPISLCRSGGCGVSAGNGKGVRIEFDDENDNIGSGAAATDTTSVAETRLNNPSLGDGASVGGLTGLSLSVSGSHMERCGMSSTQRDNMSDNASTTALAGTSITGSLSGSCYNRMEVQADVQKERCSLSGESATVSLGTISDNASTKAMAGSILSAYMPLERDNSLEVQADVESKQEKVRHGSASSSLDEASCSSSTAGLKGATGGTCTCASTCCCVQHDNHCCPSSPWSKEPSTSGGKKSKGKLWKRASSSSSSKGDTKINETRADMDPQLLEQRSTNSSEFDSPSLSGSLPSVADSHCSHFSSELSCSDPETSRPAHQLCSAPTDHHHPATTFNDVTITPMPEVENDRLERYPPQSSHAAFTHHRLLSSSPPASPKEGSSGTFLYISEESGGADTEPEKDRKIKESVKNTAAQPVSPKRNRCIQTDI